MSRRTVGFFSPALVFVVSQCFIGEIYRQPLDRTRKPRRFLRENKLLIQQIFLDLALARERCKS